MSKNVDTSKARDAPSTIRVQVRNRDLVDVAYKPLMVVAVVLLAIIMALAHAAMAAFAPDSNRWDHLRKEVIPELEHGGWRRASPPRGVSFHLPGI